jgi:2-polyprenyl-3-methyl-5-hydroxy-6-metoxy-1,4-benzoquinol methylase
MDKHIEFIDPADRASASLFVRVEHLARYQYAAEFIRKRRLKRVLDAACGNGYGCRAMAAQAVSVTGLDCNAELMEQCLRLNKLQSPQNLDYRLADLNAGLPQFAGASFDCAVCFETLEHIEQEENLLLEFNRVLRRGGWLLLSVPKAGYEPVGAGGKPLNPHHLRLYEAAELSGKLNRCGFAVERALSQPYTNVSRANMESFRRDRRLSCEEIDSYFVETPQSLEFFAKVWGWPTDESESKSNVLFFICRKT